MAESATSRSMAHAREKGWIVARVERIQHIPGAPYPKKLDAFGWMDLLVVGEEDIIGVQCTTQGQKYKHLKKYREDPVITSNIQAWRVAGGLAELWVWKKQKIKRGGTAFRWVLEVTAL